MIITIIILIILSLNSVCAQVTQEWVTKFRDSTTEFIQPVSISNDESGNSYVTGTCNNFSRSRIVTIKYSSSGILQWHRIYESSGNSDIAIKNIIDTDNNINLVGYSNYGSNKYLVILKYNSNGDSVWTRSYTKLSLTPRDMVLDKYSNVYVTSSTDFTGVNYFTMKYDSSGKLHWGSTYVFGDVPAAIALDSSQNVIVTGNGVGTGSNFNYITVKYDNNGNLKWARNLSSFWDAEGKSVGADKNGNIFVTGFTTQSTGNSDYSTLKYDSSGNLLWREDYDRLVSKSTYKILIDSSSNCFVVGTSAIIKYDSNGNILWLDSSDNFYNVHSQLDNNGNLYTARSYSMNTLFFIYTTKYGSFGNKVWEELYGGDNNIYYEPNGLSIDQNENVFISGFKFNNGVKNTDTLLTIKYSQLMNINSTNQIINKEYLLYQNYPNPFNPKTVINYELPVTSLAKLIIYDVLGNEVIMLLNEKKRAGKYYVIFEGNDFPSGVYFYSLSLDGKLVETKKMLLVR